MKIIITCVILILIFFMLNHKLFYKNKEGFEESNSTKPPLNKDNKIVELMKELEIAEQDFLITEKKPSLKSIKEGLELSTHFLIKFSKSINKNLPFTREYFIDSI